MILNRERRASIRLAAVAVALPIALTGAVLHAQEPAAPPAAARAALPALTPAQQELALRVLRDADAHGLQPKDYLPAGGTPDSAAITSGLLRYAHDVRVGRMEPGEFPKMWGVRPAAYDAAPELAQALAADRLKPWLDSLAPPYSGYAGLKRGLLKYREIAAAGGWTAVPEGAPLKLGVTDPRVPALRARLAVEDPQVSAGSGETFDEPLHQAVQRAQRRFGIEPDGVVGPGTLRMLNQPVGQRVLQIIANMERWRWMPREMPADRVQVNSGAAIVTLFKDDRPVLSMKAVSGKPGDETPMLQSAIHSVVINPPWNVPSSIANEELWPKERASPGYLSRNGFRVITNDDGSKRLQQRSEQSALGRYKFDFDNPFAVYLHDTPTKATFERFARQASHGCVRVEKPRELAEALLAGDAEWTPEQIATTLDSGKTVRARLPTQVPVFILYWTTFAGADGQMHFRSDPYDWDRELLRRVGVLATPKKTEEA
ncbi:L,D-transpeptidase family protein [Phenylobacterium sp.]|uniref:L,D-transpeptidase family protein n=1 Tax=Phenylobacterium sp. TaxID=1871053 RepID=UPI002C1E17F0|nr:L,D-transpeptidase family protein [Phenylobacterium sp.]HVI32230.1 L,D-transpeptidase family protein [Phenylobacterium sp.]